LPEQNPKLKDTVILFDRDQGISIFQNIRGYNNLTDDAEWLLERTPQKSRGFILRPISKDGQEGIWVGEYTHAGNQITRQDLIYNRNGSAMSKMISDYAAHKITERKLIRKLNIRRLKKSLKSKVIQDFRYYVCPSDLFYPSCAHVTRLYEALIHRFGKGKKIHYALIAEEIAKTKLCEDVILCPLRVPNLFERVLNLNKALKSLGLGEIRLITSDMVELV